MTHTIASYVRVYSRTAYNAVHDCGFQRPRYMEATLYVHLSVGE